MSGCGGAPAGAHAHGGTWAPGRSGSTRPMTAAFRRRAAARGGQRGIGLLGRHDGNHSSPRPPPAAIGAEHPQWWPVMRGRTGISSSSTLGNTAGLGKLSLSAWDARPPRVGSRKCGSGAAASTSAIRWLKAVCGVAFGIVLETLGPRKLAHDKRCRGRPVQPPRPG